MNDRIWLEYDPCKDDRRGGYRWTNRQGDINPTDSTEYIRADLAAERERELVEALECAERIAIWAEPKPEPCLNRIRTVLAKLKEQDDG